ncbi:MAG: hypothetical protein ABL921_07230 [Pirellula sp.]
MAEKVVKRILVSWIGHTDLKAMSAAVPASQSKAVRKIVGDAVDPKAGIGPIKTLLDQEAFDQVHLVADFAPAATKEFATWLGGNPKLHAVSLENPSNHAEILGVVRPILQGIRSKKDDELVFHLSPAASDFAIGNLDVALAAEPEKQTGEKWKIDFWRTALDHYSLFGIDDLEQARTYSAPQFVDEFGRFQSLSKRYGGAPRLKSDLEEIKQHLYTPMAK